MLQLEPGIDYICSQLLDWKSSKLWNCILFLLVVQSTHRVQWSNILPSF